MRLAFRVAYDGSRFHGSARQPAIVTVEGAIIKRLIDMDAIESAEEARVQMASRTDAGVSAAGNVVAFDTDMEPDSVASGLAYGLEHVWPLCYAVVDDDFKPRHAVRKTYRYYLADEGYDRDAMRRAARFFEGRRDMSAFARLDDRTPVREITRVAIRGDDILTIDVVGHSFLWQQVRRMVAALEQVGRGEVQPGALRDALEQPAGQDFGVAPAEHLLLLDVEYSREPAWRDAPGMACLAGRLRWLRLTVRMHRDMAGHGHRNK
ncbi:MAG: tRNA pseudouridine(38-40) synthase TruA [Thermoplasmatota archaeon]